MKTRQAWSAFELACNLLKAQGDNVVAVISSYEKKDAHFSTKISVQENKDAGVSEEHIVMDTFREVADNWAKVNQTKPVPETEEDVYNREVFNNIHMLLREWDERAHKKSDDKHSSYSGQI